MDISERLPAGFRLEARDVVDSTNSEAARLAREGAADGTVVWARRQTAGRGRQGRQWQSPEGNLYCSLILRPNVPPARAAQLSFVAALALGETLRAALADGPAPRYKWPNDVLLEGRKVAGILLESSGSPAGGIDWIIVGCGLNLAHFPENIEGGYPATSLAAMGGKDISLQEMLARFLGAFAVWRARWQDEGLTVLREAWLSNAARLGEEISVRLPGEELRGRFDGLDESGALLLGLADGSHRTIAAGDVYF